MDKSNKLLEMMIFCTVVDSNSFIAAAQKLSLSKQAVSRYISSLEERLQVRLLQRTTRKMFLTYEGQTFYLQAKSIINAIDDAENSLNLDQVNPTGLLRINVPVSFGVLHLSSLWQLFMDKYPDIELVITLSDRVVDLLDEGYDLVIRIGHLEDSSLVGRKLSSTRIMAIASPEYLAKKGTPSQPNELVNHKIIMYSHYAKKEQWVFWKNKNCYPVNVTGNVYCNNGDTCRMIALQGGGITLQPDFIVGEDLKLGQLVDVFPDYKVDDYNIYAVYPSRKLLPLRTRCLIDFLVEQLQGLSW